MVSVFFLVLCWICLNSSSILAILFNVSVSSALLAAFYWVLRIFSNDYFSFYKVYNCFNKCFNSFSLSTILFMSYLWSIFFRKRAISFLCLFILIYCYFISCFSSTILSSSSALFPCIFFFFLSRYFSKISSILMASSLSWPFNFRCWSTSLFFLHNPKFYVPGPAPVYTLLGFVTVSFLLLDRSVIFSGSVLLWLGGVWGWEKVEGLFSKSS